MNSVVLIVDDVACNIDYVEEVLESEEIETLRATTGKEAIDISEAQKPDLILLDIGMPEMDGYEVCKVLKDNSRTKHIPVIFLTARVQEEDILKGFDVGAVDYVIKPFNFRELISRVNTHLDLKIKTEQLQNVNLQLEEKVSERTSQLRKTNDELSLAYKKLTQLDKAKNEFISHINHELRTPLNGILGYLSLLEDVVEHSYHKDYLNPIQTITNRLIKVAELTLLITELKTKDSQIELENVNLNDCIKKAIHLVQFDDKEISIDVIAPNEVSSAKAETSLLTTCISIIIDNSVKYSEPKDKITITVDDTDTQVCIFIKDNGPGFSEKALQTLFNIFEADNLELKSHGFGLGLATAKLILDMLDGSIKVENDTEGGAIATICVPKA